MMTNREAVESLIIEHYVDMSGFVSGGPWEARGGRCRSCGELPASEFPADHLARMLDEAGWLVHPADRREP